MPDQKYSLDRRGFITRVIPCVAAVSVPLAKREDFDLAEPELTYRGFDIRWDGWVKPSNQQALVGQWVACQKNFWSVYSSYPGAVGKFYGDQLFDTALREHQELPTWRKSSEKDLERFKEDALRRLIQFIAKHYEELNV